MRFGRPFLAAALLGIAQLAIALDDPNAPDRVGAFERRAQPFEAALGATAGGVAASSAGGEYRRFLDAELNAAYQAVLARLEGPDRAALVESQRQWLRFRDSENRFIAGHWTPERTGSSSSLSKAWYAGAVVKDRIRQLLFYLAEYP